MFLEPRKIGKTGKSINIIRNNWQWPAEPGLNSSPRPINYAQKPYCFPPVRNGGQRRQNLRAKIQQLRSYRTKNNPNKI